jgi:DNA polymerase-3 subunit delta
MTIAQILADIKQRKFQPVYFLHGDESYYIDLIADELEKTVLTEAEKGFNQTILYGKETDIITLLSAAKRFPMMSEFQLVIVKEAQNIKFGKEDKKDQDPFAAYLENPLRSTVLVFCHKHGSLDKRLKVAKLIDKHGVLFESKKLYDNQIAEWVQQYVHGLNLKIEPKAAALIPEFLGNDLSKVANELSKLAINTPPGKAITADDIERNIGISKDFNSFELTAALGKRDVLKANKIIDYFAANKKDHPLVMVLGVLNGYFSKLLMYHFLQDKSRANVASVLKVNPYFVQDYEIAGRNFSFEKTCSIISLLRSYDLKSKGVDSTGNTEDGELMKELVWQILH